MEVVAVTISRIIVVNEIGKIPTDVLVKVGKDGVDKIEYHEPKGEGDKHYCDVYREDVVNRVFEPKEVIFKREKED